MSSKGKKSAKDYDETATVRNTPHLRENILIIFLAYLFSGLNWIVAGCFFDRAVDIARYRYDIFLGAILLVTALVIFFDRRKEMCGMLATVLASILHFIFCIMLSFTFSFWWMVVYVCEVVLGFITVYLSCRRI